MPEPLVTADSDPIIDSVYQRFRSLMPDLPDDYHDGLKDWRLVRTTAEGAPWDGYNTLGITVDLTFANGLEYHGRIQPDEVTG